MAVAFLTACAGGGESSDGSSGFTTASSGTGTDTGPGDGDGDATGNDCPGGCSDPPGPCHASEGTCVNGMCEYEPLDAGTPCDGAGFCDAMGTCIGGDGDGDGDCDTDGDCDRPNASGATCQAGQCSGWACDDGFDNCNDDMSDGCEAALDSAATCGTCGNSCEVGDNAFGTCEAGECEFSCQDPWENCDGDWLNGCEVPTGIAFQCDFSGLNMNDGCGTAYCGQSNAPKTQNFDGWFCIACASCEVPGNGMCRWCDHNGTANFFPAESCSCGGFQDLVCMP